MVGNNSWLKNNAWVNYVLQTIEEQFLRLQANEFKLIGSDTDNYISQNHLTLVVRKKRTLH